MFFQEHTSVRTLGFTSAIHGEGKSFLASLTAQVLAEDTKIPVTLLECNWENPSLNASFHLVPGPGLAEWLRGECALEEIRRPMSRNLTVIPAGNGKDDSIELLQELRQRGILHVLTKPEEVLIVDLPSAVAAYYGQLAARLVEALILIVRVGVTPGASVIEACSYLKDVHIHGVILNQMSSRVPRWLRQTL
ncbi:MAG: protein tyrosine kinase EpsB [Ktedonobacteraceae bacterium]